jgi:hypothetical protein
MTVYKKKISMIGIFIIFLLVFVGCMNKSPEIETIISLSNISEDEFIAVRDNNVLEDITIENYKKLYVNVKIKNSKTAIERAIMIPDLYTIDKYDQIRSKKGSSYELNNIRSEDIAESMSYIIFYSKGLSEDDIRDIFENEEIYISYKFMNQNLVEEKIPISEN